MEFRGVAADAAIAVEELAIVAESPNGALAAEAPYLGTELGQVLGGVADVGQLPIEHAL